MARYRCLKVQALTYGNPGKHALLWEVPAQLPVPVPRHVSSAKSPHQHAPSAYSAIRRQPSEIPRSNTEIQQEFQGRRNSVNSGICVSRYDRQRSINRSNEQLWHRHQLLPFHKGGNQHQEQVNSDEQSVLFGPVCMLSRGLQQVQNRHEPCWSSQTWWELGTLHTWER